MKVEEAIKELADKLRNRSLIPFCGAGISIPSKLPSGRDFMKKNEFDKLPFPSAMSVAKIYPNFSRLFHNEFDRTESQPNILHDLLVRLNTKYYITTNYDQLLENSYIDSYIRPYGVRARNGLLVIKSDSDIPKINHFSNIIIKFHGDVKVKDLLVLNKEHYIERMKNPTMVDGFVRFLFATNTILFLGYSLQDDNIYHILEQENHLEVGDLPQKYIVLPQEDKEFERYLSFLNVIPIYLDCKDPKDLEEITFHLSNFLFKLWCQYDSFKPLIYRADFMSNNRLEAAVQKAIIKRNENDSVEAEKILNEIIDGDEWENNIEVIPSVLGLYVGIYDKMEDWNGLEIIRKTKLSKVLNRLKENLPYQIYDIIKNVYESSIAIAELRFLNLKKAEMSFLTANKIEIDCTATNSLKLIKANNLIVGAIINYMSFIENADQKERIEKAVGFLNEAEGILREFEKDDNCHHLGRFYGTKAYISLYLEADAEKVLECAEKAHEGSFRTGNGQISGRYCHAYCYYHISLNESDLNKRREYLKCALGLLIENHSKISKKQLIVKYKNSILINRVKEALGQSPEFSDEQIIEMYSKLQLDYQTKLEEITVEKWLKLPMN